MSLKVHSEKNNFIKWGILTEIHLLEQCNFTGGRQSSFAISSFFTFAAYSVVLPLIHSDAKLLDAIAEPHPNVLNFASIILPFSSTLIYLFHIDVL